MLQRYIPVLLLIMPFLCWSQEEPAGKYSVTGFLVDQNKTPIPYANVALYKDSILITGVVSGDDGSFEIKVNSGNYLLKISFLSFEEKIISPINLRNEDLNLGSIILSAKAEMLKEVIVQGEKSQMELKLDKRVFNVGKDLSSIGGNAAEILDNVPSVTVDVEGNVSLRGSQNVRILIDGRQSGLTGISSPDALRQLQGNMIEKIEVITNPSARYDAEGEVGIINIVLKKNVNRGINGSFTAHTGYPENYGGSFNINYRKKKFNLFSSYAFNYRASPGYGESVQIFTQNTGEGTDTTFSIGQKRRRVRGGTSNNIRLGMDYYLTEKSILNGSILYRVSSGRNSTNLQYIYSNPYEETINIADRREIEREPEQNIEGALSYKKEFKREGRSFTADLKWIESNETENSQYQEDLINSPGVLNQRSVNTENERNWLFQSDYIHPFGKNGKFESGIKATSRQINNEFKVEQLDNDIWTPLGDFNNYLVYTENIYAGYIMLGDKIGNFSLQGGMRGEFSDILTEFRKTNTENVRRYFNVFPSAHISYELTKEKSVQFSYSYRLSRPRFRELLPFSGYTDRRSVFFGNPGLNPEYSHSFEGGYLWSWETGSLLSNAYYRHATGVIQRITLVDSVNTLDSAGVSRIYPVNLGTQNSYGLEFNFSNTLNKWWRLNANVNFYRAITVGSFQEQSFGSDAFTMTSRITSRMTFLKKYDFQAGVNYRAPQEIPQGRELSMYSIDLGLSTDVLKGNGTITLNVRDVLNSRKRRTILDRPDGYYSNSINQWSVRQITLTFNYRLNEKKDNRNRNNSEGSDLGGEE